MPRRNSILDHPQKDAIDGALLTGTSLRDIEGRYGVSRSVLSRYKKQFLTDLPSIIDTDPRFQRVKDIAVDQAVAQVNRIPQILEHVLGRWEMISDKLDQLLAEAEQGVDFNDQVLEAVDNLVNGDRERATKILTQIGKMLAADRSDRLATLKEMRLLAADQVHAWRDVQEITRDDSKPFVVEYRVLGRGDG